MLTWFLWRALRNPPYSNPLFQHVYNTHTRPGRIRRFLQVALLYAVLCLSFTFIWPLLTANLAVVLLVALVLSNNIFGMIWADRVSTTIARERELATYDLLCLLPIGAFGVGWALSTGSLHRSHIFRGVSFLFRAVLTGLLAALFITLLVPLMLLVARWNGQDVWLLFISVLYVFTLTVAFYFDHVQSIVLANTIGMLTPTYTQSRLNARIMAAGVFLLLQIIVYLVTLIVGFVLLDNLYASLSLASPLALIGLPLLRLLCFYIAHEAIINRAWHLLEGRFNTNRLILQNITSQT